jgi:nitrogen fixation/metabolism regulation signal transduction histidine kinase
MRMPELLTVLYFFLTICSFSGGAVQGIANYSAWKHIGAEDFPTVHRLISRRILLVYVPLFFLSVMVNIVLIWCHHPAVSTSLVVISAILNIFVWIITATLAIPIHKRLDRAKSAELIDRLVAVHLYLRVIPGVIVMIITAAMMYQTFRTSM